MEGLRLSSRRETRVPGRDVWPGARHPRRPVRGRGAGCRSAETRSVPGDGAQWPDPESPAARRFAQSRALALLARRAHHAGKYLPAIPRLDLHRPAVLLRAGHRRRRRHRVHRHRLSKSAPREFLGAFLSYTTEGQQKYRAIWRRWLHHQDLPTGGVIVEERNHLDAFGGYEKSLTRRFYGLGPNTRERDETSYIDEVLDVGGRGEFAFPEVAG